jgi:hypothetical protein
VPSPIPPPAKGDLDESVEGLVGYIADLERREQQGEPLSDDERAALIGGRPWLTFHKVAAIVQEHAPEKISEITYSSERDRQLSQATMRVVRREQNPAPGRARVGAIITPRRRESHRTRPGRRAGSSSRTSSADPGDSDPEPPAAPRWRRFTVDDHFCVVAIEAIA